MRFASDTFSSLPKREYRYLFARFDHVDNDFIKLNFVNKDLRYEDFNLGRQLSLETAVSPRALGWALVYDVAHNIAKEEVHEVEGRPRRLVVHRKGATRAFPGQPVIVPGDMGRYSFVLVGTQTAMRETFGSTCHGAGRVMSRTAAVKAARGRRIVDELAQRGVVARAAGHQSLAEEMPEAYKDVREVVDVVHGFGISTRVARLKPLGVIKG